MVRRLSRFFVFLLGLVGLDVSLGFVLFCFFSFCFRCSCDVFQLLQEWRLCMVRSHKSLRDPS